MNSRFKFAFFFLILCFNFNYSSANVKHLEQSIIDRLVSKGYDRRVVPDGDHNGTRSITAAPVTVKVDFYVRSIDKIDDKKMEWSAQLTFRQSWKDPRLRFEDQKGILKHLTLNNPSLIWKPDTFITNEKEAHFHHVFEPNSLVRIYPNGTVLYSTRISARLDCPMRLKYFPFDTQECSIILASFGYNTDSVIYLWNDNAIEISPTVNIPYFRMTKIISEDCKANTKTGLYSCLKARFTFKRECCDYITRFYMPCINAVLIAWASFWLSVHHYPTARLMTIFLAFFGLTYVNYDIRSVKPQVSYHTSIDCFLGSCYSFVFAAFFIFVTKAYRAKQRRSTEGVDRQEFKPLVDEQTPSETSVSTKLTWFQKAKNIDVIARISYPVLFFAFILCYYFRNVVFRAEFHDLE